MKNCNRLFFKKRITTFIGLVLIVITCLMVLTGCGCHSDRPETEGFEIGFQYRKGTRTLLIAAVKSKKTEFVIDDVTLDFYYGGKTTDYTAYYYDENHRRELWFENISVGIFFTYGDLGKSRERGPDYRNMEGLYFIKEISIEEFNQGPHNITIPWGPKFDKDYSCFHYCDTLTVPQDVFVEHHTTFSFLVAQILYDHKEEEYEIRAYKNLNNVNIYYNKLDNGKIYLSDKKII